MRPCSCGSENDDKSAFCGSCGVALAALSDSSRVYAVGTVLGSYRLVRQIGQGGMGRVFIAEHTRLGRQVALKILRTEYSDNVEAVKRFFAEARAVNRIKHENIIEISDFVESSYGRSFYIMELLTGVDLRTLNHREGALPVDRTLEIAIQVCRGLGAAHAAGIVHRDLKPDNIFLVERDDRKDLVKLLDFGVAKLVDAKLDDALSFTTTAGVAVGTPEYMSPEQASGGQADSRSDIYSLGVILFEMVTGKMPFGAPTPREVMVQHVMMAPPRPSRAPGLSEPLQPELENVILACLKKAPGERPQTMKEVEDRLTEIAAQLPMARATGGLAARFRSKRVRWATVALGLVVTVTLIVRHRAPPAAMPGSEARRSTAAPAAPAHPSVEIAFDSTPPGAAISRVGESFPLGITPFSMKLVYSPTPVAFEVSKPGWVKKHLDVASLENAHVQLTLEPLEKPAELAATDASPRPTTARATSASAPATKNPRRATEKSAKLDHDTMLNPFE